MTQRPHFHFLEDVKIIHDVIARLKREQSYSRVDAETRAAGKYPLPKEPLDGQHAVCPHHLNGTQSSQSLPAHGDRGFVLNPQGHSASPLCRRGQSGGLL